MVSQKVLAAEFARRVLQFHKDQIGDPMKINLWGLFSWGAISGHVKAGRVVLNPGYTRENRTVWCKPSQDFFDRKVKPLLNLDVETLQRMAGWRD